MKGDMFMPWESTCPMEQRIKFVFEYQKGELTMAAICRAFGITRKTGYKWLRRYETAGLEGLREHSRAPLHHPNAVDEQLEDMIVELRGAHPTWGPVKLVDVLERKCPEMMWPAPSTVALILKRNGLSKDRKRKRRVPPYTQPFAGIEKPNDTWCADFKGWFRMSNNRKCYPLTISDAHSRYLICCQGLHEMTHKRTKPLFQAAFIENGMPDTIRTDNGTPFASKACAGLSRLSVWMLKLGIMPERIQLGHPEQNGRHERIHRTLKAEATRPPERNLRAQQRRFDTWRREYNHDRPHQALGNLRPAEVFEPARREYPLIEPQMQYPKGMTIRRVRTNGEIKWRGRKLYLSEVLAGEPVGLEQIDDRHWSVSFGPQQLLWLDDYTCKFIEPKPNQENQPQGKLLTPPPGRGVV